MKTLKETLEEAILALEAAHSGLKWYRDMHPEEVDGSDDEADFQIEAAIKDLQTVVAQQDAQTNSVALVAHCGGLIGLSESEALIVIRKLTLPHSDDLWGLSISETQARLKEVLRTLERTKS